jgi:Na+/H+ antiporter NhaD/arsenite permease-like protein
MSRNLYGGAFVAILLIAPDGAHAAAGLEGAALRWPWALPFISILVTIATGPLLFKRFWHRHYGKLAFLWSVLTLAPLAAVYGASAAFAAFVHTVLAEYLSFIVLLFALYVVAGGILVTGELRGTPLVNAAMLAFGTLIASVVGTTGAAMILIRPLLRANAARLDNVHVLVFFIFLVANIGGALSPLGDPPLFIGFLHGVDFFWTMRHIWFETALVAGLVLAAFIALDVWHYRKDRLVTTVGETKRPTKLAISGSINVLLIAGIVVTILAAAVWKPALRVDVYGTTLEVENIARDAALVLIAILSLVLTPNEHREANGFTWEPIAEVAILSPASSFASFRWWPCSMRARTAPSRGCSPPSPRPTAARTTSPISG